MQGRNDTKQKPPVKGDGTIHQQKPEQEANWHGTSHEPQEEFVEQSNQSAVVHENDVEKKDQKGPGQESEMSEGKPTF